MAKQDQIKIGQKWYHQNTYLLKMHNRKRPVVVRKLGFDSCAVDCLISGESLAIYKRNLLSPVPEGTLVIWDAKE